LAASQLNRSKIMPDLNSLRESLAKKQAEVATLEKELLTAQAARFTDLPAQLGLDSIDAVILALADHASPRLQRALKKFFGTKAVVAVRNVAEKAAEPVKAGRRKRTKVTPELKVEITKALEAGDKTAGEVAAAFGVSGATVNNIKRDAGLTKKRA
jgi:hypothetical protein